MGFAPRADGGGRRYRQLLAKLFAARRFGVELGLERIEEVVRALGSPHEAIDARVVIAGTNGKGSTAAFLESIAGHAGKRTGVFSSPHLARFAERFRVAGEPADERTIVSAADRVRRAGGDRLTFFEQCTALALVLFADAGVDFAIFEVGLGGRLDSTKVVAAHVVAVTGVALDHQDVLGETLFEIATEKVGAADPGTPLILGRGGVRGSLDELRAAAAARGLKANAVEQTLPTRQLGLRGRFQRRNAQVAEAAADALGLSTTSILEGLEAARLAGRFETINSPAIGAELVIDGAHNRDGARALLEALAMLPRRDTILVLAVSAGKDAQAIAAELVPLAVEVWLSAAPTDRAMDPVALARTVAATGVKAALSVVPFDELPQRIAAADSALRVVAAGSLLFVGALRARLLGQRLDPISLSDPAAVRK